MKKNLRIVSAAAAALLAVAPVAAAGGLFPGAVFYRACGRGIHHDHYRTAFDRKRGNDQSWDHWLLYRQNIRRSEAASAVYHFQDRTGRRQQ